MSLDMWVWMSLDMWGWMSLDRWITWYSENELKPVLTTSLGAAASPRIPIATDIKHFIPVAWSNHSLFVIPLWQQIGAADTCYISGPSVWKICWKGKLVNGHLFVRLKSQWRIMIHWRCTAWYLVASYMHVTDALACQGPTFCSIPY